MVRAERRSRKIQVRPRARHEDGKASVYYLKTEAAREPLAASVFAILTIVLLRCIIEKKAETKLYYLINRYYDPEVGRFISPDHIGYMLEQMDRLNGCNLYAYCLNNPVMHTDPEGNLIFSLIAGLIITSVVSGMVNMVASVATAAATGEDVGAALLGGLTTGVINGIGTAIGMAIPGFGFLVSGAAGFLGGMVGNVVEQAASNYNKTGKVNINWGEAAISGA